MNAVIYARYSSHNQTEQSIEGQLRDNYAWAKRQDITVIGEYIDRALSGTSDQRPEFQRMIADAAKKQFEMIIVWKLDRFARNRFDSAIYKNKLKKYGVRIASVNEAISDGPEGIIMEGLLEAMNEYYSANLSQNIRRGQRESISKGHFVGGNVPYGYKVQDHKLVPDDKTAPIIRYVFKQYAAGVPKKEIIEDLTARGIRRRNGKPLALNAFAKCLTNTAYIGEYRYSGQIVDCVTEPLIDRDTFDRVQEKVKVRAQAPAALKAKVPYLLQGKVFCGHCGAPMTGECGKSKTGDMHYYYICSARKRKHICKKKAEKKYPLEKYIVESTLRYVLTPSSASRIAKAVVREYKKEFSDTRIDEYEKAIAQIDRETDKLVDALIDAPKVAHKKIYERMETLEAQKSDMEIDLAKLRVANEIALTEQEVRAWLSTFRHGDPDDTDFQQRVIDIFVNSVYIYDDRIVIFYNIRKSKPPVTFKDLDSAESALPETIRERPSSESKIPERLNRKSKRASASAPLPEFGFERPCSTKVSEIRTRFVFVNGIFGIVIDRDGNTD